MTLAEVAEFLDRRMRSVLSVDPKDLEYTAGIRYALAEFQKDPEFKLPDRLEALSAEMKSSAEALSPIEGRRRLEFARRLDEILGSKRDRPNRCWRVLPYVRLSPEGAERRLEPRSGRVQDGTL